MGQSGRHSDRHSRSRRPRLRLFVAAYPPPEVADALARLALDSALQPLRRLPAAEIHLTLQFVGDTPVADLDHVIESVDRAASGLPAFTLLPAAPILVPGHGRARVLAVPTDAPGVLLELHRRLAQRLATRTRRDAADRFLPHLTIARFPGSGRQPRPELPTAAPDELPPFVIDRIHLVKSRLAPAGAVHESIAAVDLGAA